MESLHRCSVYISCKSSQNLISRISLYVLYIQFRKQFNYWVMIHFLCRHSLLTVSHPLLVLLAGHLVYLELGSAKKGINQGRHRNKSSDHI